MSRSMGPSPSRDQGGRNLAVPCLQRGLCPTNVTARLGCNQYLRVAGLEWCDTADAAMNPVSDGAKGVVVEARHLTGIDSAVRRHRVPALPDLVAPIDWVEPRRAFTLEQQAIGLIDVTGGAESVHEVWSASEPVWMW